MPEDANQPQLPDPREPPGPREPTLPRTRFTLGPSKRLTHAREYQGVYAAKMRKSAQGVSIASCPNTLQRHRLGLAISRGVGTAALRTRFKRLIREAFRLHQRDLPTLPNGAYLDIVVSLRSGSGGAGGGSPRSRDDMARVLRALADESAAAWARRLRRGDRP